MMTTTRQQHPRTTQRRNERVRWRVSPRLDDGLECRHEIGSGRETVVRRLREASSHEVRDGWRDRRIVTSDNCAGRRVSTASSVASVLSAVNGRAPASIS